MGEFVDEILMSWYTLMYAAKRCGVTFEKSGTLKEAYLRTLAAVPDKKEFKKFLEGSSKWVELP